MDEKNELTLKITSILTNELKDKKISIIEYSYLSKILENLTLVNSTWLIKILNRIKNQELFEIIKTLKTNDFLAFNDLQISLNIANLFKKFKKNIHLKLNNDQKEASMNLINFISDYNVNTYGLFGYAGTGKTTLAVELLAFLIKNRYIKSIAFTAPTNKALTVIKGKFRKYLIEINNTLSNVKIVNENKDFEEILDVLASVGISIEFMTIHKMLKFESEVTDDGDLIFTRNSGKNLINNFDVVIVDECSMIPIKMIDIIISEVNKNSTKSGDCYKSIPKIIFAGDPAQLPPIFEDKSAIFIKNKNELSIDKYISSLESERFEEVAEVFDDIIRKKHENNYEKLVKHIIEMANITMKEVMRNRINSVVELCYQTRLFALNKIKKLDYSECINKEGVYFYDVMENYDKLKSEWFKKFQKKLSKNKPSIILTWTNKQADIYNNSARKLLFNKENVAKFEKGDILILGNFYDVTCGSDEETLYLHTSEQIKVDKTSLSTKNLDTFPPSLDKQVTLKLKYGKEYNEEYQSTVEYINERINKSIRCWKLLVHKLDNDKNLFDIWVIDAADENKLKFNRELTLNSIKRLKKILFLKYKNNQEQIKEHVINPFKKLWYDKLVRPFAQVSYGYAITCHKSQGSDFYNVFVDVDDISRNIKENEMKQCLYTAVTRTSNQIYLLI